MQPGNGKGVRKIVIAFGLLLLLVTAQQGAVRHELSHLGHTATAEVSVAADQLQPPCDLCLAFAQLGSLTSHSVDIPQVIPAPAHRSPEPRYSVVDRDGPTPRSRGPPVRI
jgi:hypothetical protein